MQNLEKILKDQYFMQYYLKYFITEMAKSNLEMERLSADKIETNKIINMYENMNSFIHLIENNRVISPYDAIEIANNINKYEGIAKGFRKIQVEVRIADFFPISSYLVPQAIYNLFDNYNNTWSGLNIYEKEARFHIEFVRIQPFEDGNKRTARIITNYNLYRQNLPPIIIEGIEIKKYFSYINNYDIDGFTEFIRQKSTEEYQRIISLYNFLCDNNFINKKDDNMEKEDKIIKKIVKDLKINL